MRNVTPSCARWSSGACYQIDRSNFPKKPKRTGWGDRCAFRDPISWDIYTELDVTISGNISVFQQPVGVATEDNLVTISAVAKVGPEAN